MQAEADSYVQVITAGEEPFQIVWASEAWLRLCEYTPPQVLGHTLEIVQGPLTDRACVASLMDAIRRGEPITVSMINHTRTGKPFSHTLRVEPLRDSRGHVQCFQATSSAIDESVVGGNSASSPPPSRQPSNALLGETRDLPSPHLTPDEEDASCGGMRRTESNVSISGMLPRAGSELQISEMLDLFDQQGHATPKQEPTEVVELPPTNLLAQQPAPALESVAETPTDTSGTESFDGCSPLRPSVAIHHWP